MQIQIGVSGAGWESGEFWPCTVLGLDRKIVYLDCIGGGDKSQVHLIMWETCLSKAKPKYVIGEEKE
jgi:hypothetical protein